MLYLTPPESSDIEELSGFACSIIEESPEYNEESKRFELARYSHSAISALCSSVRDIVIVAKIKDRIVGFIHGVIEADTCWICWIGVISSYRKSSVAGYLWLRFFRELKDRKNIKVVWGVVRSGNSEFIQMLERLGFQQKCLLERHFFSQDYYLFTRSVSRSPSGG